MVKSIGVDNVIDDNNNERMGFSKSVVKERTLTETEYFTV